MSREIGFKYGEALDDYFVGIRLVESKVKGEVRRELDDLDRKWDELKHKCGTAEKNHAPAAERLEKVTKHRSRLEERRNGSPSEFSLFKGIFYVSLSILLLSADVSILGQVIARFLDYDWRSPNLGMTFAQAVFTAPIQAFKEFPDLFSLTLAVLIMGLFLKVWQDSYASTGEDGERSRNIAKWQFWIATFLLFLSVLSIVVMASARLTINIGRDVGMFPRVVSTILGFSLPFVSAGFFIKGYDIIGNRILLWRLSREEGWLSSLVNQHLQAIDGIMAEINIIEGRRSHLASEVFLTEKVAGQTTEFDQGYREGVARLLSLEGSSSIFERFRPIVLREYFSQSVGFDEATTKQDNQSGV